MREAEHARIPRKEKRFEFESCFAVVIFNLDSSTPCFYAESKPFQLTNVQFTCVDTFLRATDECLTRKPGLIFVVITFVVAYFDFFAINDDDDGENRLRECRSTFSPDSTINRDPVTRASIGQR